MAEELSFALVGNPVRHSISPAIHTAAFAAVGLPHAYVALDTPTRDRLENIVGALRTGSVAGVNVTIPYKKAVLELVDSVAPSAQQVGAANVLVRDKKGRVIAHNTDVAGLAEDLRVVLGDRPRSRAVVLGAGGAGLAAIAACKVLGYKVIGVTTRSWNNSEAMFESSSADAARALGALTSLWPNAGEMEPSGKGSQVLRMQWSEFAAHADLIIQATSAGMEGAGPGEAVSAIVPWDRVGAHAVAYDVVYRPRWTPFLQAAQARGLLAIDGVGMLVRQAALSFELWLGSPAPVDAMRAAAEKALAKVDKSAPKKAKS